VDAQESEEAAILALLFGSLAKFDLDSIPHVIDNRLFEQRQLEVADLDRGRKTDPIATNSAMPEW
jgi:hypothetical protein